MIYRTSYERYLSHDKNNDVEMSFDGINFQTILTASYSSRLYVLYTLHLSLY